MRKDLFKPQLLLFVTLCIISTIFSSCSTEEITEGINNKNGNGEDDVNHTEFVSGAPTSRTSMDVNGNFFWEKGDKIYVVDDDDVWQLSSNSPTERTPYFKFKVPGKFTKDTYRVIYKSYDYTPEFDWLQNQRFPNSFEHIARDGDHAFGYAKRKAGKDYFEFKLKHTPSFLVFLPYSHDEFIKSTFLSRIVVYADKPISGRFPYDFENEKFKDNGYDERKYIHLSTMKDAAYTNENMFPMNTSTPNANVNGACMVIKPGTYQLKILYQLRDEKLNGAVSFTKYINSHTFKPNEYVYIKSELSAIHHDIGHFYYMWDAKKNFWDGHEWDSADPWQPLNGTWNTSDKVPTNESDPRYANVKSWGPETPLFKSLPNANELSWYVMKGDPHYDGEQVVIADNKRYFQGGIWFLKKAYIEGFSKDHGYDNSVYYRNINTCENIPTKGAPAADQIHKYFFLPFFYSYKTDGRFLDYSYEEGNYWSSTPVDENSNSNYLLLRSDLVKLSYTYRQEAFIAKPFSAFGEDN